MPIKLKLRFLASYATSPMRVSQRKSMSSKLVKMMAVAMMVSGVGLFLIGAAAFLHDCQSILSGDSCGSTTVESFLSEFNLFYYNGNAGEIVNNLMLLPFSYVLFGMGTAAFIVGGLGSLRGR